MSDRGQSEATANIFIPALSISPATIHTHTELYVLSVLFIGLLQKTSQNLAEVE